MELGISVFQFLIILEFDNSESGDFSNEIEKIVLTFENIQNSIKYSIIDSPL